MWDSKPHLLIFEGWFVVEPWDLHSENQPHSVADGVDHNLRITSYWTKGKWAEAYCFRASKSIAQGQRSVICALVVTWKLQRTLRLCKDQLILVCQWFSQCLYPERPPSPQQIETADHPTKEIFFKELCTIAATRRKLGKEEEGLLRWSGLRTLATGQSLLGITPRGEKAPTGAAGFADNRDEVVFRNAHWFNSPCRQQVICSSRSNSLSFSISSFPKSLN